FMQHMRLFFGWIDPIAIGFLHTFLFFSGAEKRKRFQRRNGPFIPMSGRQVLSGTSIGDDSHAAGFWNDAGTSSHIMYPVHARKPSSHSRQLVSGMARLCSTVVILPTAQGRGTRRNAIQLKTCRRTPAPFP